MDMSKLFVSPNYFFLKNFTLDISNTRYLEVFKQSHQVRDNEVRLYMYARGYNLQTSD